MLAVDSRSKMGMYDCVAGRFSAVAAALRRFLQESSHGDVPIVNPCDEDTTEWNVWKVGREMSVDWWVIQKYLTAS